MIVWHVTSLKKANKFKKTGFIVPPVRAWENIQHAERMCVSTVFDFEGTKNATKDKMEGRTRKTKI